MIYHKHLKSNVFSIRFVPSRLQTFGIYCFGYGVPVMIVAITLIISAVDGKYHYVRHQMDQMVCWIDLDLIIWCFVLPVSIIIVFNLGVVVMIVNIAYHSASHQRFVLIHNNFLIPLYMSHFELKHFFQYRRKKRWSKIFKITRNVLILSVLLGVTWLLGFLLPALNG